jgi:membrane protein YqaA with SNARE-associated domain
MQAVLMPALIASSIWKWLQHLGGPGLIALGIADASLVPLPGSIDALTIVLAASDHKLWPYYAAMAMIGSVAGGYITYRIGLKGGQDGLEKKVPNKRLKKITSKFEKKGFGAVFVTAILPPPVPMAAFVLAAGALEYPQKKFLAAFSLGRALRFFAIAYLASRYGKGILGFLYRYYEPLLYALLALLVAGIAAGLFFWWKHKHNEKQKKPAQKAA